MDYFELHPQLANDTKIIGQLPLCQMLLCDNALFPWVILVPKRHDIVETTDLTADDQTILWQEINALSTVMQQVYSPDKMNIATLGNMVQQLHIHLIARFKTDEAWPNPIWGQGHQPYKPEQIEETITILQHHCKNLTGFLANH